MGIRVDDNGQRSGNGEESPQAASDHMDFLGGTPSCLAESRRCVGEDATPRSLLSASRPSLSGWWRPWHRAQYLQRGLVPRKISS